MKVTSSGTVFRWVRFANHTDVESYKYRATRGNRAGKGYRQTWVDGQHVYVHSLVCAAFHGPKPAPDYEVNHKNGQTADNRPSNLEWSTPKENSAHRVEVLGKRTPKKINYDLVKDLLASGRTGKSVADELGVSRASISLIKNGKHK